MVIEVTNAYSVSGIKTLYKLFEKIYKEPLLKRSHQVISIRSRNNHSENIHKHILNVNLFRKLLKSSISESQTEISQGILN